MNREYVQQYARLEKEHWWFVVRQKIILRFLQKHTGKQPLRVLNIGAAAGASSEWLSTLGEVVSLETEPLFIEHLEGKQIKVTKASVTNMPFEDDSFDLVCAFDVIEHVEDDLAAMKEIKRVCKPGGVICVTVPAFQMLWSGHDVVNGHYRRYTKNSLRSLGDAFPVLKEAGISYFNFFLFIPIFIARKSSNLFAGEKKREQSDFTYYKTNGFLNAVYKMIFSMEVPLMRFIQFPFGVSLIAAWRK